MHSSSTGSLTTCFRCQLSLQFQVSSSTGTIKISCHRGQSPNTVGRALVLHSANPGWIPGIPYDSTQACQERFLDTEPEVNPWALPGVAQKTKQTKKTSCHQVDRYCHCLKAQQQLTGWSSLLLRTLIPLRGEREVGKGRQWPSVRERH